MEKNAALRMITASVLVAAMTAVMTGCAKGSAAGSAGKQGAAGNRAPRQMVVETQIVQLSDASGGKIFTGSVVPAFTTNLSSKVSGRVVSLEVKVGDHVKAGQAIARIDTSQLQQQLDQQKSAAVVTQAQYNKAVSDQTNAVNNAEKALAIQQASYDKTLGDQQNAVVSAKQAVALAQAQLNNAITTQQNAVAAAKQGVAGSQASLNNSQVSSSTAITVAQNNLNATLDNLLTQQNNNLQTYQLNMQQALSSYNAAAQSGVKKDIDAALTKVQSTQLQLQQAGQAQYKDAQSAQQSAQSQLTSLQNALLQAQSSQSVQVAQEALNSALLTLANAQGSAASQIDVSQQQLFQSQLGLANVQGSQPAALNSAKASLDQAEQTVKASKTTAALQVNAAQLQQAETAVQVLSEQLQDGMLTAPFDGVVTSIVTPPGQNAGAQTAIVSLASVDPILATVNVSEASIGKFKVGIGMSVKVPTLNKTFEGQVVTIHPTMDATTKSYGADIKLSDVQNELLPGMFAESSLKNEGRQAIMVPADAVLSQPNGNAVFIVKDGKASKVLVNIGEMTSTSYEITSGLKVGDELVVKGQELLSDKVPVQVMQPGQSGQQQSGGKGGQQGTPQGGQPQKGGKGGQQGTPQDGQQQGGSRRDNPQNGQQGGQASQRPAADNSGGAGTNGQGAGAGQ